MTLSSFVPALPRSWAFVAIVFKDTRTLHLTPTRAEQSTRSASRRLVNSAYTTKATMGIRATTLTRSLGFDAAATDGLGLFKATKELVFQEQELHYTKLHFPSAARESEKQMTVAPAYNNAVLQDKLSSVPRYIFCNARSRRHQEIALLARWSSQRFDLTTREYFTSHSATREVSKEAHSESITHHVT